MITNIRTHLLLCLSIGVMAIPALSHAQEYMFTYSKLFSQLKYNTDEKYKDVKVSYFFVDANTKQLCNIEKAWMEKEDKYEELPIIKQKELSVPIDNNLRQANPLVFVQTPRDKRCDFSMVVMSRQPLSNKVTFQQIASLIPQMQSLLEELGGMFASWFTPSVEGITLEFESGTTGSVQLSTGKTINIDNGRARILLADLKEGDYLLLPKETARVLPWLPSAK